MMANLLHLTDENFDEEINKNPLVLVDFWAEWCAPCRIIAPLIEQLAGEYQGKLLFGKVNVDENPSTASKYRIMSIPSLLFFKEGKLVDKVIGAVPKNYLVEKINKYVT